MAKNLVIVESPAKAKTINKYLGNDYTVEASLGHIMDLPKNGIGVELKKRTFEPDLIISPGKEKLVDKLKKLAAKADAVYLAPDPDREGEAIAYHLQMQLQPAVKDKNRIQRVTFNEITKKAVTEAFTKARAVDKHLMEAQQTRRVLDRLVGYEISPLLWDKVRRGLSAGRVQTVALRLIVDRENEIRAFRPVEYWPVDANLKPSGEKQEFTARLYAVDGRKLTVDTVSAPAFADGKTTEIAVEQLKKARWTVASVEAKERRRNAPGPYTTSRLQQDAANRLGFNVRRTMGVAQRLYEGVELGSEGTVGLITYMRTDSTRVSPEAVAAAREYIGKKVGAKYLPEKPNVFKGKKDAQDAHEAIRPTNVENTPDAIRKYLSDEQYKLYRLIWQRFVASQMVPAVYDQTAVEIEAKADKTYHLRVTGSVLKFDGFLKIAEPGKAETKPVDAAKTDGEEDNEDRSLPPLKQGQALDLVDILTGQKFTEPPPRYNEASLVKELEERGIGRPSTYASIINTIQERDYAKKIQRRLVPTEIGMVVTSLLVKNFPYIFDMAYTARLEDELDEVESGREKWTDLLNAFYEHLEDEIKVAAKEMETIKTWEKPTNEKCEKCGSPLVLRWGKFGSFYACSNFSKAKPMSIAVSGYKKDPKAAHKKILAKLHFPMIVKGMVEDAEASNDQVEDNSQLVEALKTAAERGKKIVIEPVSCDYTRENYADKPDLSAAEAGAEEEEEYCDACGKQMVLKNGPWGPFMACQDYNADPPCRTIRRLNQKVQQKPPEPTGEPCPECGMELVKRQGSYGEFVSCSGYPKCKYVKQNYLEVPCPKCGGKLAERKARTGNVFYGCVNYPKCDFTSNQKLVPGPCPKCGSTYLVEVPKEGTIHLVCPNNAEAMPKKRKKKGAPEEELKPAKECTFDKDTGVKVEVPVKEEAKPLSKPDPEKTRPVVEVA
ncbi:MAG: type I DNA topoisomerase [Acidobacteria bacterium]|nr:type I DNA topoisomerase [Acidobacteriota bacterium]